MNTTAAKQSCIISSIFTADTSRYPQPFLNQLYPYPYPLPSLGFPMKSSYFTLLLRLYHPFARCRDFNYFYPSRDFKE
ncbi:unnamed protein product [Meloidogyne enterolobii]|uniref:Uncharacterized protein n=1 Tax=Meloidogyne enterolobii TaxID=390850 RepID=A0ACB0ZIG5_MELEN